MLYFKNKKDYRHLLIFLKFSFDVNLSDVDDFGVSNDRLPVGTIPIIATTSPGNDVFLADDVNLQMPFANSKTKFGKISSLLNNFKSLRQIFEALFSRFCTTLILLWRKYNAIGQVFILVYVHLVTLFANSETRCWKNVAKKVTAAVYSRKCMF